MRHDRSSRIDVARMVLLCAFACLALLGATGRGPATPLPAGNTSWESLLSGIPAVAVRHVGGLVWAAEGTDKWDNAALLVAEEGNLRWKVAGSVDNFAGLSVVGETAWLGGGHAPVGIARYDPLGYEVQRLPEARHRLPYGEDLSTRSKSLKPLRYLEGMAANERYLWAWFMGGMILVTRVDGKPDWQPYRYAAQLSDEGHYFYPRQGWAWGEQLVCLAAPGDVPAPPPSTEIGPGWPVRLCLVSARTPDRGRRVQPPAELAGYTLKTGDLSGDDLWLLAENQGRVKDFVSPRWALVRVHLPDLRWELRPLPADFQSWTPLSDDLEMSVCGESLALGSAFGPAGTGDLVLVQLERGKVTALTDQGAGVTAINDLELEPHLVWVAHERGLSRAYPVELTGLETGG